MEQSIQDAKVYLENKGIPELFEAIITSLMYSKPDDHVQFIQLCLDKIQSGSTARNSIKWDSFIDVRNRVERGKSANVQDDQRAQSSRSRIHTAQPKEDRVASSRSKIDKELQHVTEARKLSGMKPISLL